MACSGTVLFLLYDIRVDSLFKKFNCSQVFVLYPPEITLTR
jgi:hypothetical protein